MPFLKRKENGFNFYKLSKDRMNEYENENKKVSLNKGEREGDKKGEKEK